MYRRLLRTAGAFRRPFPPTRVMQRRSLVSSATRPAGAQVSIESEGETVVDLTFVSEALGVPASLGYGWAQFDFGDRLGQDDRYKVTRKLGWGMHSSIWLAHDELYVASNEPSLAAGSGKQIARIDSSR